MKIVELMPVIALVAIATSLAFLALAGEALATNIIGETLQVNYETQQDGFGLNVIESENVVVGAGIELEPISLYGSIDFNIDITADTITLTKPTGNASFGGLPTWVVNSFVFTDINGMIPDFDSFSILSQSGVGGVGLSASNLSFTADTLEIYLGDTFWSDLDGSTATFEFSTVAPIPEPGTLATFGLGLVGLACTRRRSAGAR